MWVYSFTQTHTHTCVCVHAHTMLVTSFGMLIYSPKNHKLSNKVPSARYGKPFTPLSCWLEKSRNHPSPNYRLLLLPLIVPENLNIGQYFWRHYAWTFICYVISRQIKDEMVVNIQVNFITIANKDMFLFHYVLVYSSCTN